MIQLEIANRTKTRVTQKIFGDLLVPAEKNLIKERKIRAGKPWNIELTLVGDAFMTTLNRRFHHKNRSTDVISLSYFDEQDSFVGEIFISVPYAKRQAEQIRQPLTREFRFLFIHGLLHLFGYDHQEPDEEAQMKKLTYRILGRR